MRQWLQHRPSSLSSERVRPIRSLGLYWIWKASLPCFSGYAYHNLASRQARDFLRRLILLESNGMTRMAHFFSAFFGLCRNESSDLASKFPVRYGQECDKLFCRSRNMHRCANRQGSFYKGRPSLCKTCLASYSFPLAHICDKVF